MVERDDMQDRFRKPLILVLVSVTIVTGSWLVTRGWSMWRIRTVAQECAELQRAGRWARLLRSAREWKSLQPDSREARQAGVAAGKALRDVEAVEEFLNGYPCQLPEDIPLVSMLADLNFGPLNDPIHGAAVCRDILKVTANHRESHRRLVFFYAMTQQQVAMQQQIQESLKSNCELPEIYAYSFLGSGLQLSNGISMTQRWLNNTPDSELLLVARALHFAKSVSGAVPTSDEKAAEEVRQRQSERASKLQELLSTYPNNVELLAYHLQESVHEGAALRVGELLMKSPPEADSDYRFWHARGWVFARLAEFDEAERCYRRALSLHALDWRTQFHLAELLRATGRLDESDMSSQLAADGRSLERDLLEQPDMQSIPTEIYQRLAEYSQRCEAGLYSKRLLQYLNGSGASQKSGSQE